MALWVSFRQNPIIVRFFPCTKGSAAIIFLLALRTHSTVAVTLSLGEQGPIVTMFFALRFLRPLFLAPEDIDLINIGAKNEVTLREATICHT
jgi:hypothetical protein